MTTDYRTIGYLRSTALATLGLLVLSPLAHASTTAATYDDPTLESSDTVRLRVPGKTTGYTVRPKLKFDDTATGPAQNVRYTPVENTDVPPAAAPAPMMATPMEAAPALPAGVITHAPTTTSTYIAPPPLIAANELPAPVPAGAPEPLAAGPMTPADSSLSITPGKAPAAPAPLANAAPMAATPPAGEGLSDGTKQIFSKIPSKLNTPTPKSGGKLAIKRMSPEVKPLDMASKSESFDSGGLSIKVARPGLDTNFELNRAYTALMGGDTATATATYKNILSVEPNNQDALFGLASTYHRMGDLEHARPYYAQLLKVNPNHREGLNNFLALASEESPQDALAELGRLEERNPDFSPIPAQEAVVLNKLGYGDQAREKMMRAIELSPDNLTYKYNLAIMLDHSGDYTDASALYRLLIDASLKGAVIPAPLDSLQKRLNYIAAAPTPVKTAGS